MYIRKSMTEDLTIKINAMMPEIKNRSLEPVQSKNESPLNAKVSNPDMRFAQRLLEQFGGPFRNSQFSTWENDLAKKD